MGTKKNPGEFDCYENAEDDEPMFVLLARDRSAPDLVEAWANYHAARDTEKDRRKVKEALQCAKEMRSWYAENRGAPKCLDRVQAIEGFTMYEPERTVYTGGEAFFVVKSRQVSIDEGTMGTVTYTVATDPSVVGVTWDTGAVIDVPLRLLRKR